VCECFFIIKCLQFFFWSEAFYQFWSISMVSASWFSSSELVLYWSEIIWIINWLKLFQ
jgi:hypothetical protein